MADLTRSPYAHSGKQSAAPYKKSGGFGQYALPFLGRFLAGAAANPYSPAGLIGGLGAAAYGVAADRSAIKQAEAANTQAAMNADMMKRITGEDWGPYQLESPTKTIPVIQSLDTGAAFASRVPGLVQPGGKVAGSSAVGGQADRAAYFNSSMAGLAQLHESDKLKREYEQMRANQLKQYIKYQMMQEEAPQEEIDLVDQLPYQALDRIHQAHQQYLNQSALNEQRHQQSLDEIRFRDESALDVFQRKQPIEIDTYGKKQGILTEETVRRTAGNEAVREPYREAASQRQSQRQSEGIQERAGVQRESQQRQYNYSIQKERQLKKEKLGRYSKSGRTSTKDYKPSKGKKKKSNWSEL